MCWIDSSTLGKRRNEWRGRNWSQIKVGAGTERLRRTAFTASDPDWAGSNGTNGLEMVKEDFELRCCLNRRENAVTKSLPCVSLDLDLGTAFYFALTEASRVL